MVPASAHHDAIGALRHFLKDIALLLVYHGALLQLNAGQGVKRATYVYGVGYQRLALDDALHVFFGKLRLFGDLRYYLVIIVCISQLFRQSAPDLSAAAAEFSADGDYSVHNSTSLDYILPWVVPLM